MAESRRCGLWWWIDRWRRSSAFIDMTLAEQGAYRNLLDELRLRGGSIPNDERTLAKACGDPLEWPNVRDKVMKKFRLVDGVWINATATEVNAVSDALSEAQAEKGRKRAEAAAREKGRFTSPASRSASRETSRPPAEAPAAPPASVAVAVAVSGAVAVADGNGSGADAPVDASGAERPPKALAVLGKPERRTWLTRPGELWRERWGDDSEPPWGEMAREFEKPRKAFEARGELDDLWTRWERFLAAAERAEWARPARFVQGLGQWAEGRSPPRVGRAGVGDLAVEQAKKAIEAHRARRGE
jgi:uncharacterized protein YdaU (DUF1376 family)